MYHEQKYSLPDGRTVVMQHLASGDTVPVCASTKKAITGPGIVMTEIHGDGGRDQTIVRGCSVVEVAS